MVSRPESATQVETVWLRAIGGLSVLIAASTIWLPPRIPSQDAPLYHLAIAVLGAPERFAGYIEGGIPLSGAGVQVTAGLLLSFLEPTAALKVVLTLGLAVQVAAGSRLARQLERSRALASALCAALYVGWVYAMGFFNFLVALALASWACVVWLDAGAGRRERVLQMLALALAAYVHVIGMAFVGMAVGLAALLAHGPRWVWRRSAPLALAALYTLSVLVIIRDAEERTSGIDISASSVPFDVLLPRLPQMVYAAYSPLAGLLFVWAVLALVLALARRWRPAQGAGEAERLARGLAGAGGILLVLALATPHHVSDWYFVQPRLLPLCFGLPLIACLPSRPAGVAGVGLLVLAVLAAGLGPALREGERVDGAVKMLPDEQLPVGMAFVQLAGMRSPHLRVPYHRPGLHVHAYGMRGGGASHFTFPGNAAINPMREGPRWQRPRGTQFARLDDRCAADPGCLQPRRRAHELAAQSLHFDTLLLPLAPDALVTAVRALGWRWIAPYAFEVGRASLTLRLVGELPDAPVIIRAGFPATIGVVRSVRLDRNRLAAGSPVEFGPLPAGPLALEAFVDHDRNNQWNEGDTPLLNATGGARPLPLPPGAHQTLELRNQTPPKNDSPPPKTEAPPSKLPPDHPDRPDTAGDATQDGREAAQ